MMLMGCALAVGMVVVAMAMPQKESLDDLESQLVAASHREQEIAAEKTDYETELRALREDPAFLEMHARDRLDYYREGEKILKFRE
jgi:cell division protein FtsB